MLVGVLDSGISSSHPDLASQIAKVAAVKVVNDDGYIFPEAAVCGFMWAAEHGMQVTNNSYYIDPWQLNCRNDPRQRPVWQAVQRAIRYSQSKGVLNVVSAGNSNWDLAHKITDTGSPNNTDQPETRENLTNACLVLPAEVPGVVTVGAVGPTGEKSYYSSYGQGVIDVTAPGGDTRFRTQGVRSTPTDGILSTTFDTATRTDGWGYKQGTSMSGPHAAGVAALAASAHPGMTPGQLSSFLERSAEAKDCPAGVYNPVPLIAAGPNAYDATCSGGKRNGFYGAGMVNAYQVVR